MRNNYSPIFLLSPIRVTFLKDHFAVFFHGSRNGPDGVTRERRKGKYIDTQKGWVLGDCVYSDGEFLGPQELSVDCVQLNREVGLLHTAEQGGRVILSWEAGSIGEQSLGNKHPERKRWWTFSVYIINICARGRLCHPSEHHLGREREALLFSHESEALVPDMAMPISSSIHSLSTSFTQGFLHFPYHLFHQNLKIIQ